ncbi:MAG: LysR family transcriptional regulator [Actinomycetes bacterium]
MSEAHRWEVGVRVDSRELECFLVLGEELHFGRTAERLFVSQGRVSQLVRALESRVGAKLFERTSRRVALTPIGSALLTELRPAYTAVTAAVERAGAAARGVTGVLRVGFVGTLRDSLLRTVWGFQDRYPDCDVQLVEVPLADPFGHLRRGAVDTAMVPTPVAEADLVVGSTFSTEPQALLVAARHRFGGRTSIDAEELAECPLIGFAEPAPRYWREHQVPTVTPAGRPIPRAAAVCTVQEGLVQVAGGRGALLICEATARYHSGADVRSVRVDGLPHSSLSLVWHQDRETTTLRAFARAMAG